MICRDYQLTVDKIFYYSQQIAPDQKLVYAPPSYPSKEFTYTEFAERVNRLGNFLETLGVKRGKEKWGMGTRVAVMDWNSIRYQELMYAVPMYGATLYTVNIRLAPEEIIYTMNVAEPEILFVDMSFAQYLKPILQMVSSIKKVVVMSDKITCTGKGEIPEFDFEVAEYEEALKEQSRSYEWPDLDEYVVAGLFFTSGTTGRPKGVYHTHRQFVISSMQLSIAQAERPFRISNRDIVFTLVPYFHIFGWMTPYTSFIGGNMMVFPGRYEWRHVTEQIMNYLPIAKKVDGKVVASGVPTMLYAIVNEAKKMKAELKGLQFGYGGEALPLALYEDAKKLGIDVVTGYGPSETLTAITRSIFIPRLWMRMGTDEEKLRDHFVVNNSLGVPVPLTLIKLVDDEGDPLPHDGKTPGRALFCSPSITRGYYKDEEKTDRAWRFGWFDVDDICTIDEHYCIMFVDREKDAIKSGGEWIPSARLEGFISTHPAVKEVAVIAMHDPKWVERPMAVVVAEGDVTEEDIKEFLMKECVDKGLMPKWWLPDKVVFVDEIPKTSTGKMDKKKLRERFVER
ncbi:AMP-binding protein [Archaeoglobus sp.]